MARFLTKSRFKVAYECPARLFYHEQPTVYGNKHRENEFLRALAQGGFQVGALAKTYFQGGIDLEGLPTDDAIARTQELLKRENVTIFEAAIQAGPFLVRADVLKKIGAEISLIEVKSSSFDSSKHVDFFKKREPGIDRDWEPYLVDVAFQAWVAGQAYPGLQIASFLMLADKSVRASVNGLHQCFRLATADRRIGKVIVKEGLSAKDVGDPILKAVPVDREIDYVISEHVFPDGGNLPGFAKYLAENHLNQTRALMNIGCLCKTCEFRIGDEMKAAGLKSGFEMCWTDSGKISDRDEGRTFIFDLWNCRKTEELLGQGKIFFDQLEQSDLKPKGRSKKRRRLDPHQRQWIQVQKRLSNDRFPYVDEDGLREILDGVMYPIHCIDFETTMVAIPFHKGRHPYEQIGFQFSHHVLQKDGGVAHVDQYLDVRPGVFPNFDFVRKLRQSLFGDDGTIFRYAAHENSVLRQIRVQLGESSEPDKDELVMFIDSITQPRKSEEGRPGRRNMLDLREIVLEHYFHPLMGGSNSIKKLIPAVLEASEFLRRKYSEPIYGKGLRVPSKNFDRIAWVEVGESGRVKDPYGKLPPVFTDIPQDVFNDEAPLFEDDSIDDGGAAMTAWSRMQFTEMGDVERSAVQSALLKYCELDTLSMVWLLEYWRNILMR